MTYGVDECWFDYVAPATAYNYGCRCTRCTSWRKRYDGQRSPQPRRRRSRKGTLRATSAPTRNPHNEQPYIGPCRCERPYPERIPMFGCYQCGRCGMPLPAERINDGSTP